jgi:hypothetical protein
MRFSNKSKTKKEKENNFLRCMGENRNWSKSSNGTRERRVCEAVSNHPKNGKVQFSPSKNMRVASNGHKQVPAPHVQILITRSNIYICVLVAPELQITQVTEKKKREAYIVPINQHGKKDKKLSTKNSDAQCGNLPALLPRRAGRDTSDIAAPERVAAAHAIALSPRRPEATSASSDHGLTAPPPRPRRSGSAGR